MTQQRMDRDVPSLDVLRTDDESTLSWVQRHFEKRLPQISPTLEERLGESRNRLIATIGINGANAT